MIPIPVNGRVILFGVAAGLVVVVVAGFAARKAAGLAVNTAGDVLEAINPVNQNNVFVAGANAVTKAVTGEPTLGGQLARWFDSDVRAADAAMAAPVVLAPFRDNWDLVRDRTIVYQPPL